MNEPIFSLSDFAQRSTSPSAVNELTASFAKDFREGIDINLGVGYVNDSTIPKESIAKAYNAIVSNEKQYRNTLNYGSAKGAPALRNAIKNYYVRNNIGELTPQQWKELDVCIGANGATSILESIADIIKPGIVITSDPFYYIYTNTLKRKGFTVIAIPEESDGINLNALEETLRNIDASQISFFYIVTVNNPSTVILSNFKRQQLCTLIKDLSIKHNRLIPLFFDKAYEDIIHANNILPPISGLQFNDLGNVFEIGTLSKVIAPALRIGYLIAKESAFTKLLVQKTSDIGFSAPLITQNIAAWLLDNIIEEQRKRVNKGYKEKSSLIKDFLATELSEYVEHYEGGKAAFYYYITLKRIETDRNSHFYKYLSRTTGKPEVDGVSILNSRLVYIPGEICSNNNNARYQLRIAYGHPSIEALKRALKLIKEACVYSLSGGLPFRS